MKAARPGRSKRRPTRPGRWVRPALERLENRTLFAGHTLATAAVLTPGPLNTAQASGFLATTSQDDLYRIHLDGGDVLNVAINAQPSGGALQSVLSVQDPSGKTVAQDAQESGDPRLTFQAAPPGHSFAALTAGDATPGRDEPDVNRRRGVPLAADLAGGSFRLNTDTAAYGDTVSGTFRVQNRGGADVGAFDVQVVLSGADPVGPSVVLATYHVP